jgi:class 3 adenylate cyclase
MDVNDAETAAPTERTFAFVDLAGFTALTEAHGDETAVDVVERFVGSARAAVAGRGNLVKTIGDAVMLVFANPESALLAARDLLERCAAVTSLPAPRAGLHHGPALSRGDDWFGATVNLAARVAGQAFGGQTLATTQVASAAHQIGVPVIDLGCFQLRNLTDPVELFQVELIPPPEAVSIDPVCRMQVAHATAAGRLRHAETDLWFCSLACVKTFVADPARYVQPA